jgi:hypothetical protein
MTALSKDRDTRKKPGQLGVGPVAATTLLYGGAVNCFNAAGYLVPGADTAGLIFAGIGTGRFDNTLGQNGSLNGVYDREGLHMMNLATAITQANVGDQVYLVDDQTVDLAANVTNLIFCGVIAEFITTTLAYIDITPAVKQTDVATHMADTVGAHAASAISLLDSGAFTSAAQVEAALAEIYPHVPVLIADPGAAGAISPARSGNCALTTAAAETRTLAIPARVGTLLAITLDVDGGDAVITVAAAINQTGNNTITMGDAGDTIVLEAVQVGGAKRWRVLVNDGCALSTVG